MSSDLHILDQFEVGGTFFELIEFSLIRHLNDGTTLKGIYGVNVAKVREVVHMPLINPLASGGPGIAGIFELRGVPIPAINLCRILGDRRSPLNDTQQIIVTEFSEKRAGFIVSTTHRIRRISWDKVLPPSTDQSSCMSGMILIEENKFLFILDLEKILNDIETSQDSRNNLGFSPYGGSTSPGPGHIIRPQPYSMTPEPIGDPNAPGILFVDDSKLVLSNVTKTLRDQGFRVITANNGVEAYEKIQSIANGERPEFGLLNCLITDIEMPLMDGLTLVRKVREDTRFDDLPILLHTSLSGEVTQNAAQEVGANGYVIKNDVRNLLGVLNDALENRRFAIGA